MCWCVRLSRSSKPEEKDQLGPSGPEGRKELKMCVRLPGLQDYGGSEKGGVCDGGEI